MGRSSWIRPSDFILDDDTDLPNDSLLDPKTYIVILVEEFEGQVSPLSSINQGEHKAPINYNRVIIIVNAVKVCGSNSYLRFTPKK